MTVSQAAELFEYCEDSENKRSVLFLPKCGVSKETQSIKTKYGDQRETGNFLWLVSTAYE